MNKIKFQVPTHDPYTGELNPHYEEITGKKNPLEFSDLTKQSKDKDLDKMPNQKWHQIVSFIKSGVRIIGYVLIPFDLIVAASVLVFSEIIGIVEELV